jgi:predicted acylesterase/phospholipase RssA
MAPFRIGINMAGAVSAGAYTAGVLDFLIQALDQWHEAKARGDLVPSHDVSIEVMSGASAGGMCAAIGSVALQEEFPPVTRINPAGDQSANKLYTSWVEKVDIQSLLQTNDLQKGRPVVSLLDSTVLSQTAQFALTPGARKSRKYISPKLTLFLTLTNLRGTVYDIDPANGGTFEEQISFFADVLQFETVAKGNDKPTDKLAKPLPLDSASAGNSDWQLLQQAALATGAVPVALAPRVLQRDLNDYINKQWQFTNPDPKCTPVNPADPNSKKVCQCEIEDTVLPDFGQSRVASPIPTVNVDGGVTNNSPFELARRYLVGLAPVPPAGHNNRDPLKADRAVVTIAPFPGTASFDPNYDVSKAQGVIRVVTALFGALLSQSRFLGESINLLKQNDTFSRFVIAPSDDVAPSQPALMCSALGAFAGLLSKDFRDRDFQLGRRNCQYFLQQYFVLDSQNPVIQSGLQSSGDALINKFRASNDPRFRRRDPKRVYMPIIPLCGTAAVVVENPGRRTVPESLIKDLSGKAADRLTAVAKALADESSRGLRTVIGIATFVLKGKLRDTIQSFVMQDLGSAVEKGK